LRNRLGDVLENAVRIQDNVVVPEAQNLKASALQVGIACAVAYTSCVLAAVSFHNEHVFESDEINDPCSDRHLSPKFRANELT